MYSSLSDFYYCSVSLLTDFLALCLPSCLGIDSLGGDGALDLFLLFLLPFFLPLFPLLLLFYAYCS